MMTVEEVIARALHIDTGEIDDALGYQSIVEWDSLGHVSVVAAIEEEFDLTVEPQDVVALRSVADIKNFVAGGSRTQLPDGEDNALNVVRRGLEGVEFDVSTITRIDGEAGDLAYRGLSIDDLVERTTVEEVTHLLVHGYLPTAAELRALRRSLYGAMTLPPPVVDLIAALRDAHPLEVLRTAVSALGALAPYSSQGIHDESLDQARERGIRLIGQIPAIVGTHLALRSGREVLAPSPEATFGETVFRLLTGRDPSPVQARVLDKALIVHADHSANASAFTARVVTGTDAGVINALTAAISAFMGRRHGGASEGVLNIFSEVRSPQEAGPYVQGMHAQGRPVMGFGHRVYRTTDPRVRHLRGCVIDLVDDGASATELAILDALAEAMAPRARHGVAPNVDLYAGLTYRLLGIPDDAAVAMFVIGRTPGWVAHVLEQRSNNVLIRPLLRYSGRVPAKAMTGEVIVP